MHFSEYTLNFWAEKWYNKPYSELTKEQQEDIRLYLTETL